MPTTNHRCTESRVEHLATREEPFQFADSGLSYVYLIGIKYYTCECGRVTADIPAVKELMQLIARDLLRKPSSLTGEEIRFLRKRLGKKQADFAKEIGIEPETLSRYENDKLAVSETADKLIRLYFIVFAEDDQNLLTARKALQDLLAEWRVTSGPKKIVAKVTDNEWEEVSQAA